MYQTKKVTQARSTIHETNRWHLLYHLKPRKQKIGEDGLQIYDAKKKKKKKELYFQPKNY